jgi:hypothetical protein
MIRGGSSAGMIGPDRAACLVGANDQQLNFPVALEFDVAQRVAVGVEHGVVADAGLRALALTSTCKPYLYKVCV